MRQFLAWALFDLANTFFAVAMLSFYFPLWVVETRGGKELWFSLALGISMAVVALIMPLSGALSDAAGERMRFLRWTTYGCTAATVLVGMTTHLGVALVLFGIANICYQLGTVFYDALLWTVAAPGRLGQASGIGAAFGYLGSTLGLVLLWPFVHVGGYQAAFAPAALCFLLFALPSFLVIRETPALGGKTNWRRLARNAAQRMSRTVRSARALAGLWRYFWAAFFSLTAINTVLVFMGVYARTVMGFTVGRLIAFFVFSQLFAVAGSLSFGRLIARWGAKRTLAGIWAGWMAALALVAAAPSGGWYWFAGPVIGFCLGSTWATARVLVVELSPKDQLAEMFGLAGLFGRAAAIVGPLLWGVVVWDPARYRPAVLMLVGQLAVGLWLLRGVPASREEAVG
ncbi:MAG: MFS transporter [Candidatus Omnitrophica bacterium]|nr:MFS transporter [Candidatus Omnitrophota bacterium]